MTTCQLVPFLFLIKLTPLVNKENHDGHKSLAVLRH
jgi:hypothetical protein